MEVEMKTKLLFTGIMLLLIISGNVFGQQDSPDVLWKIDQTDGVPRRARWWHLSSILDAGKDYFIETANIGSTLIPKELLLVRKTSDGSIVYTKERSTYSDLVFLTDDFLYLYEAPTDTLTGYSLQNEKVQFETQFVLEDTPFNKFRLLETGNKIVLMGKFYCIILEKESGRILRELTLDSIFSQFLASPDNEKLYVAVENGVRIIDLETGSVLKSSPEMKDLVYTWNKDKISIVESMQILKNGDLLIVHSDKVHVLDGTTLSVKIEHKIGFPRTPTFGYSNSQYQIVDINNRLLITGEGILCLDYMAGKVLWETKGAGMVAGQNYWVAVRNYLLDEKSTGLSTLTDLPFAPGLINVYPLKDEDKAIVAYGSGEVICTDLGTGKPVWTFDKAATLSGLYFNATGELVILGGNSYLSCSGTGKPVRGNYGIFILDPKSGELKKSWIPKKEPLRLILVENGFIAVGTEALYFLNSDLVQEKEITIKQLGLKKKLTGALQTGMTDIWLFSDKEVFYLNVADNSIKPAGTFLEDFDYFQPYFIGVAGMISYQNKIKGLYLITFDSGTQTMRNQLLLGRWLEDTTYLEFIDHTKEGYIIIRDEENDFGTRAIRIR
jgi:hypothetical protein